ncbi:hypothetical protein BABINDRAFT_169924 [Babjeviella inositovora NRRL Y-12698]|uniref:Pre-mRNA-splicing factor 38 n=1 Tax=Babjeviella inositovora NRRL Y-12698 TaxID=984486 RepID=A0A1E3QYM8_9ASCO|nr:uncharacterized protein BABINDRAFT_169924 [Babjeviella inositovora NRRL Y-12698]ODQ82736.1 hypothetical protein BABINDRAFT_169924 [Babjeviella inositovora NRRL Y-12698]
MSTEFRHDRGLAKRVSKIHGVNPVFLIEKISRERILDSFYWKRDCFGLNTATLLDRAVALQHIGGYDELQRPTPFICLGLKMLQLQPAPEIITYLLHQRDFKYLTCLAAFYIRLTLDSAGVYRTLEPLYADYRKIRYKKGSTMVLSHIDEFIDELLTSERSCDMILPRMVGRLYLEDQELLEPRKSEIDSDLESDESESGSD